MTLEFTPTVEGDFLRITATGEYVFSQLPEFIRRIREEAEQAKKRRVLIDCRKVEGDMTESERFLSGQWVAGVFGGDIKAVLLVQPEKITKLGELAAVNRGADFLVTGSSDEAEQWLAASPRTGN